VLRIFSFAVSAGLAVCILLAKTLADTQTSRIYVVAYPCPTSINAAGQVGAPTVTLYDQAFYGDNGNPVAISPSVTVTRSASDEVDFYFDQRPGSYDAFIHLATQDSKSFCGRNGPLVAIPGKDRHIFVAANSAITDWHAPAAIAGTLPIASVSIWVFQYDRRMKCGDDIRSFDPNTFKLTNAPGISGTTIDDGAYYGNFHAYGNQDHKLALQLTGALFSHATVLLTALPDTKPNKPPFIRKDITEAILHAAMATTHGEKLICIPGF